MYDIMYGDLSCMSVRVVHQVLFVIMRAYIQLKCF